MTVSNRPDRTTAVNEAPPGEIRKFVAGLVSDIRSFAYLVSVLPRSGIHRFVLMTVGVVASGLLPLVAAYVTANLVGRLSDGSDAPVVDGRTLTGLSAVIAVCVIGDRVLNPLVAALAFAVGSDVERSMQMRVATTVSGTPTLTPFANQKVLDVVAQARRARLDVVRPRAGIEALASLAPGWIRAVGAAVLLGTVVWWMGLAWVLVWSVLVVVVQQDWVARIKFVWSQSETTRRAEYYRDLMLKAPAAKEVRTWSLQGWISSSFSEEYSRALTPAWESRRLLRPQMTVPATLSIVACVGSYAALILGVSSGAIGLAGAVLAVQALMIVSNIPTSNDNSNLAFATVAVPAVRSLERMLEGGESPPELPVKRFDRRAPGTVSFHQVTFAYPGSTRRVLQGVDFEVPGGSSLAIVGENGAGKTTLVKVLCGLYGATSGTIRIDDVPIQGVDLQAFRRELSVVFQDFTQYPMTFRENITLGREPGNEAALEAALEEVAQRAGLGPLLDGLPRGWDTVLSSAVKDGVDLSGGQWKRVAIGRALWSVLHGARFLVLDEPTAGLDITAQAELNAALLDATHGVTTFLVSHQFSTVRRADKIIVLDGGRVTEAGSHRELLALNGKYAADFRTQAGWF